MSKVDSGRTFTNSEDVAEYIVGEFAAENMGVAEVIPSDEIEERLDEVVDDSEAFEGRNYDDLYVDVKDAVLEQDVIIA
jgi:hypothetical protein